jgi:zinc/manganese transport system substrate-binding protein
VPGHRGVRGGGWRLVAPLVAGVVVAVPVVGRVTPSGVAARSGRRLEVVATVNMWGSIASQLAGAKAHVTSIITNPSVDPHSYEPTPADARLLASASYVIENGVGYDPWASRLLAANPTSGRAVLDVARFLGVPADGNPHQWYSPDSVQRFVDRFTSDLERHDPRDGSYFSARHAAFERALGRYHALIAEVAARFGGTPVGASESIFVPLAPALQLSLITPPSFLRAVSEGTEPTAADKATVDQQIRSHAIKVFVFNSQNSTPDIARLVSEARRARIPVTTVTETLSPASTTFQAWQSEQLQRLLSALEKAGATRAGPPAT